MPNIITIGDFFDGGELNIPGTEQEAVSERVTEFIVKYEPDYLKRALGYPLWKLFNADNYTEPETERFQNLLNGDVEFEDIDGNTKEWIGLKATGNSPIANYIWFMFTTSSVTSLSSVGVVKGKAENAVNTSAIDKQCRAWNEMADVTCLLWEFLEANADIYPEFDEDLIKKTTFKKTNPFNL